jgi:hypothetical protein
MLIRITAFVVVPVNEEDEEALMPETLIVHHP